MTTQTQEIADLVALWEMRATLSDMMNGREDKTAPEARTARALRAQQEEIGRLQSLFREVAFRHLTAAEVEVAISRQELTTITAVKEAAWTDWKLSQQEPRDDR